MTVQDPEKNVEPKDASIWRNIGKAVLLIIILVIAWYVLDWLMGAL